MAEAWLSGPVAGVPPLLMPIAHAWLQALEDLTAAAEPLTPEELWRRPGGAASVGFHLRHVAGVLDRLFTYARGEQLTPTQLAAAAAEAEPGDPPPHAEELLGDLRTAIERALQRLRNTPETTLLEPREVGRKRLPSNVLGLYFHSAEHAQRHAGQAVATSKIIRGTRANAA